MVVYRLARRSHLPAMDGQGASKYGARWNSIGIPVVYTSESRALAFAEVAVHLTWGSMPNDFVLLSIEIPDNTFIEEIKREELPYNWEVFPFTAQTQRLGDQFFLDKKQLILKVPSAVVPGEYNYLINPNHPEYKDIRCIAIVDFPMDRFIQ